MSVSAASLPPPMALINLTFNTEKGKNDLSGLFSAQTTPNELPELRGIAAA